VHVGCIGQEISSFRSLCLTASATSMVEVERFLRPGDRDKIRVQIGSTSIPSVIQEVRRTTPTATMAPLAAPAPIMGATAGPVFALPPTLPYFPAAPVPSGLVARSDGDAFGRPWRYSTPRGRLGGNLQTEAGQGSIVETASDELHVQARLPLLPEPSDVPGWGQETLLGGRRIIADDDTQRGTGPGALAGD
jgi:hypothetical protein